MTADKLQINSLWQFDISDIETGKLESTETAKNVITTEGLNLIAALITNRNNSKFFSHCAIGTGTTLQTAADTALVAEVDRALVADSSAYGGTARIVARFTHSTDRDITEAGLFDAATGGNLLARVTTQSAAQLRSGKALTITIRMSIS